LMRAVCKRDFTTLYRVFLNTISPQLLLGKVPSIWSAYYDTGTLTQESRSVVEDRTRVRLQLRDLETTNPLFAITTQAYLDQLMHMSGAQHCVVQRENERVNDGKLSCDYAIEFDG